MKTDCRHARGKPFWFQQLLWLALLIVFPLTGVQAQAPIGDRILVIYSSTDIGDWEQAYNSALIRELANVGRTSVTPEFLSLVGADQESSRLKAESLRLQYDPQSIRLIVTVFPEAATFVRAFSGIIAPNAYRLYVLPDEDVLSTLDNEQEFALQSSIETTTLETLKLMEQILPNLEQVYLAGGNGEGDKSYMRRVVNAIEPSGISAATTVLQGLTPEQLVAALAGASRNDSAIVLSTYDTDNTGQPQRTIAINDMLSGQVDVPVFSMFDSQLGRGAVGGNMSAAVQYAMTTIGLADNLLDGESIPKISSAATEFMFDGERLNYFDIDRSLLPEGSIILNDPPRYLRENLRWIILAIAIIIIQLALIAALLTAVRRRKLAEEELKTTQKMEALGSLAGGIAHDFNNILMAIMANAELAKTTLNDPEKANTRLGNILSASNRAKGLIAQILMFSRQAATGKFENLNVETVVRETAEQLTAFMPRHCELELHIDNNLPTIEGDSNQLHQAIMNICINSQHAMKNEGVISLSASTAKIEEEQKLIGRQVPIGEYVCIAIRDNGQGIRESELSHIFEPFYTTKPTGKGTGLGLALVYRIVRAHHGFIDVQSEVGKNTTFTLYLPVSESGHSIAEDNDEPMEEVGGGERILLVDDDDMVLDATKRTLEKLNYKVDAFSSSMEALKSYRADPDKWQLLFTDLSMPEMDGARLASQIRQISPAIPVILYTGYLDAVDSIELEDLRILSKPSRLNEIAEAVHEAVTSKRSSLI